MDKWEYRIVEFIPEVMLGGRQMQLTIIDNGVRVESSAVDLDPRTIR